MADYKKPDYWALKAQKEGYPARSVYKLREIDEKFGLLRACPGTGGGVSVNTPETGEGGGKFGGLRVLDLGAAPGSWSLFILRKLGAGVFLSAADLSPLSRQYDRGLFERGNFHFVRGDITQGEIRETLLAWGPFNLILSDAAPATTGNRPVDTLRSRALAEAVVDYAEAALVSGGNLAVKVFQGGDTQEILKRIRGVFKTGKSFKPAACRPGSFEIYYLGLGRL
jgi:23S rRNA (uridine2552-2'-O)-methyltransferase